MQTSFSQEEGRTEVRQLQAQKGKLQVDADDLRVMCDEVGIDVEAKGIGDSVVQMRAALYDFYGVDEEAQAAAAAAIFTRIQRRIRRTKPSYASRKEEGKLGPSSRTLQLALVLTAASDCVSWDLEHNCVTSGCTATMRRRARQQQADLCYTLTRQKGLLGD